MLLPHISYDVCVSVHRAEGELTSAQCQRPAAAGRSALLTGVARPNSDIFTVNAEGPTVINDLKCIASPGY